MKTHTSSFKEQIKLMGKEIDSRITFGDTVLGKDDLNAVTPSYQGAILKSVMKQLDIDSNVEIPIGTILKYEFGLKVNGEYEYINYGNYVVYNIEKQEDTNSYKITCYDKLLYSMLDYVKLPITYPISIRDYINSLSTALGLKFANKSGTFANYNKQIQADLYDGLGYTFRDILDELAQVTASTICLNNNDELEVRYITETGDTIDEEFLKDVNVNFGEKFGKVNTIVLSRSAGSDNIYYPTVLPTNPYEIKISDNQIMNGNDRADFLPDIYNRLNGLEFYTNDFVSTGIIYYDLCDRYSVKVGDNTYSCVMFNDEVLVTQGLEENIYTELPEQTETDYKHASKDDRMINQVYIIAKKNEAEILAVVNTTEQLQKEINPIKDESGSSITIEDASDNPLVKLEIEGKSKQETRSGKNIINIMSLKPRSATQGGTITFEGDKAHISSANQRWAAVTHEPVSVKTSTDYHFHYVISNFVAGSDTPFTGYEVHGFKADGTQLNILGVQNINSNRTIDVDFNTQDYEKIRVWLISNNTATNITNTFTISELIVCEKNLYDGYEKYGVSPSPEFPSEIESVGYENIFDISKFPFFEKTAYNSTGAEKYWDDYCATKEYIPVEQNTTYTYSNNVNHESLTVVFYDVDKNVLSVFGFQTKNTFTTPENCKYIRISLQSSVIPTEVQLEKGNQEHSYIPYGKYGIEVKTVGENLLESIKPTGTTTANGLNFVVNDDKTILVNGISTQQTAFLVSEFLYNNYGGKYVKGAPSGSSSSGYCLLVSYYDENSKWKADVYDKGNGVLINGDYPFIQIAILIRNGITVNNQIFKPMIVDNIDTEYKPYQKNASVIVLDAPLRSLPNGVKDIAYIRNNKLYVDRYTTSIILNGTGNWAKSTRTDVNRYYINGILNTTSTRTDVKSICSHFKGITQNQSDEGLLGITTMNADGIMINIDKNNANFDTLEKFKTWLSNNNSQYDYQLATPVTEELDEIETLKTLKGYNNISTTDKLLPIINLTYVRDTIIADYVENHVTELKLTENEIKASVKETNKKLTDLENIEEEHYSELVLKSDQISSTVSKKIGSNEVVSSINQSAEQIELKGNRVVIESDNFNLDKDGTIKAKAGEIAGFNATEEGFYYLLKPKKDYTQDDINKLSNHIYQGETLTNEEKELYDVNNDGNLNLQDIALMGWTIENNISKSMPGKFQIGIPKVGDNPYIIDFGLYNGFGELLNGFTYNKAIFVDTEINGNLTVTGSKNRIVNIGDKSILLNAYETTIPYFGDIGSNITDENGYCKIEIEEIFSKTIESDDYKVFIQKCGQGDLYVIKHKKYFEVKGTPNLDFDWEIKAIQKGFKNIRLQEKER